MWGNKEAQTTAGWMTTPTREKTISANRGGRKKKEVLATMEDSQVTATAMASDVYGSDSEQ
ncbi:hypothetical protein E2562_024778 [Oryza meyeriana var. granulata]|uniref:Uncharacterized protein n=1 Tax=Oryza meyeriana var. granulata TaxID=110450 RepID=A0A6G1E075_9ORYZ|nr:hypothetical protein E2562_024778 [Oryza meyeriana var. granulata]